MSSNPSSATEPDGLKLPKRHPRFYFLDGNLVIIVEDTIFRVYGGLLAQSSSVFADMQGVPQPSNADLVDEVPSVTLPGDASHDFSLLLSVLLGPVEDEEWTIAQVLGVLRVAHKYFFEEIVKWANRRIKKHTPTLENIERQIRISPGTYWTFPFAITVIKAARQFPLPLIFESIAFYCLAILIHQDLKNVIRLSDLGRVDLQRLLEGPRQLQAVACGMVQGLGRLLEPAKEPICTGCRGTHLLKYAELMERILDDPLRTLLEIKWSPSFIDQFDVTPKPYCWNCNTRRQAMTGRVATLFYESLGTGEIFGKH